MPDGVDVVGSLAPKFETDIKSEYSGIVTDVYVTEWVHVEQRHAAREARQSRGGHARSKR